MSGSELLERAKVKDVAAVSTGDNTCHCHCHRSMLSTVNNVITVSLS